MSYTQFIESKVQDRNYDGFAPLWIPEFLRDFQVHLCEWMIRKGRAACFADCGMGKTPMQLVWGENMVRHTGKPTLIATPLAVAAQTVREANKFGIDAAVSRDGKHSSRIVVTNYERLHYFNPAEFGAMACDESSGIKDFEADRTAAVTEFMRRMKYRSLWTATAAPNDFIELGTSSEALGYYGYRDMLTKFFKMNNEKDHRGWGRVKWRFRGHAEQPFWQWVCSWARSLRRPSDLGFSDEGYQLPPLHEREVIVSTAKPRAGCLFTMPARDIREERAERRHSIKERCERAAQIISEKDEPFVWWGELNEECDLLEDLVGDDVIQVKGSMKDEAKEEAFEAFSLGQITRLITKPKIGAWGLNWQHCCNTGVFPSHSFEQYYQLVRRFYRFGQMNPVNVSLVLCEGQSGILQNLRRKQEQAAAMFESIVAHMNDAMHLVSMDVFPNREELPTWL